MNDDVAHARWFKSSFSQGGSDCVEVAFLANGEVGVRDSKCPSGPSLTFTPGQWEAFTASIWAGELAGE
ncbi:DUF397 domain-containing protein [Nocardia sp. NPDC055321]